MSIPSRILGPKQEYTPPEVVARRRKG